MNTVPVEDNNNISYYAADGPHHARLQISPTATLLSCLRSQSIFRSLPGFRKRFLYRNASSALLYGHTYIKSMDQPGRVANPARGQMNREMIFPCQRSRLRIWFRETRSAVSSRVSLLIAILRLNLVLTYGITPKFRGGVHIFI